MNYLVILGIGLILWVFNIFVAIAFKSYTKGYAMIFDSKIVENGNNIFVYGLLGTLFIFLGNTFSGWLIYLLFGIWGIISIFSVIQFVGAFVPSFILVFNKNDKGLEGTGKLSPWIFLLSMVLENTLMIYISFLMFTNWF